MEGNWLFWFNFLLVNVIQDDANNVAYVVFNVHP